MVYEFNKEEQYIVVEGCKFDSVTGESQDYKKNTFIITVNNLINPPSDEETAPVSSILSKSWDNGPAQIISTQNDFVINEEDFKITVQIIEEASHTTSDLYVGRTVDNVATFIFTPVAPISSNKGKFEIESPEWVKQYQDGQVVTLYPFGDVSCTASQFESIVVSV